jgi:signal transduction histidine kinase
VLLRLAFDIDTAVVLGDAGAIRRVLDNLLVNAIAASSTGGDVAIHVLRENPNTITVRVIDQGPGLSPEQQARIFEPLVRFRAGSGLGLGLAIARELTRAMNGEYGVISALGTGSTFWIRLPCDPDATKEASHADRVSD